MTYCILRLAFMPRTGTFAPFEAKSVDEPRRGRPSKTDELAPIAPYDTNPARTLSKVFDSLAGRPVRPEELETYAEVLCQFHISPEHKLANGDYRTAVGRSGGTFLRLVSSGSERRRTESGRPDRPIRLEPSRAI